MPDKLGHLPALCDSLNEAVVAMTNKLVPVFQVSDHAPSEFAELCAWLDAGRILTVYSGGSDATIFGCPEVNYAFRAWHDWTHWKTGFDFSLCGEMWTCNEQVAQLLGVFASERVKVWIPYLTAEVIGQRLYYERYREYILDQRSFVLAYMEDPKQALKYRW